MTRLSVRFLSGLPCLASIGREERAMEEQNGGAQRPSFPSTVLSALRHG